MKWAVGSVEDPCKMQKTNSIERKIGAARPQTARSEQNYRHLTELICNQEGNGGSSKSRREMINLIAISLSSGCCMSSCHRHKRVIANVFSHCVKIILWCFDYIVIFLYKILTQLSGFSFVLCRKKL